MQAAAFAAAGLDWEYLVSDVPAGGLAGAVSALREPAVAGANVTIPHKVAVMPLLDDLDPLAAQTGAVNTVVTSGGRLRGHNTDVAGIRAALREVGSGSPGGTAVVLGLGGSARAAAVALLGFEVTVVSRRPGPLPAGVRRIDWADPERAAATRGARVLLNATPLGRGGEMPVPEDELPESGAVIDLVYAEGGTALVRAARERGLRAAGGFTVLAEQGAAAFELWTGRPAPRSAMRAALPPW